MPAKTKILYDGNCVVCDVEISHYKRKAPELFELLDISAPEFKAESFGLSRAAVDRDLHVLTPDGSLKIGVDAFAHIWSRIPGCAWAGRAIRTPGVYRAAKAGYWAFTVARPYLPKKRR